MLVLVGLLLQRTRLGTAMRAVADEHDLAEASGIDVRRVILVIWVAGAALAALGGSCSGSRRAWSGTWGSALLLRCSPRSCSAASDRPYGAMVGGLLIGVVTEVSTYWIESKFKSASRSPS